MVKTREEKLEYQKQYRLKNKEKINQYRIDNKEKFKEYTIKNIEKIKEKKKEWRNTPQGKKSHAISRWRHIGLKSDDYDEIYTKFSVEF